MVSFSGSWTLDISVLFVSILVVIYLLVKHRYTYWERKGFKSYPNPKFLFGHLKSTFTQKEFIGVPIARIYKNAGFAFDAFVGIYVLIWPILLVCDPQTVRNILTRDFQYFTDRGIYCDLKRDPISGHLFALSGQKWKDTRVKLSPAFSSGKLKAMFTTLLDCGSSLQRHLEELCNNRKLLDVYEVAASYSTNVIASVGFGIDVDSIKDPQNEFRACGRKIFEPTFWNGLRLMLMFIAPKLMTLFRIKFLDGSVEKFITTMIKQNLQYREKNNVSRKDFFQLLIQLRNSGTVQLDGEWETVSKSDESKKLMTVGEMAAPVFTFFVGGFETTSTTMTFCMYELAKNPEIQSRVHEEIDRVLKQHDGQITYDSISEMKYLEACVDETLRKYSIVAILNRLCVKDYKIPGTDKVIEKGTSIYIPVMAMQMDEQFYEEPEKFQPERFIRGSLTDRPYYSFGDGPRICIGMKMAKMQTKVGIVLMLLNHKYELRSTRDMEFDPKFFLTTPKDPVKLRITKRIK